MAINKVVYSGRTLIDLTSDTVSPSSLLKGIKAHDKRGNTIIGTYEPSEDVENLLEDGFSSGNVTYVDNGTTIIATNNTTGQVLTKEISNDTVTITLTEAGTQIGRLVKTFNIDYSIITSINSYSGLTSVKTFDYENHVMSLVVKNSAGSIVRSITKQLQS